MSGGPPQERPQFLPQMIIDGDEHGVHAAPAPTERRVIVEIKLHFGGTDCDVHRKAHTGSGAGPKGFGPIKPSLMT